MNEGMEAAVDLCTILHTIYYIGPQGVDNVNTCSFFIISIQYNAALENANILSSSNFKKLVYIDINT